MKIFELFEEASEYIVNAFKVPKEYFGKEEEMKEEIQPQQIWNTQKMEGLKSLIDMMKDDEQLGLYEEPENHVKHINDNIEELDKKLKEFKHKVRVIPKQEILDNRCSAYEFINFNKEVLEEAKKYDGENAASGVKSFIAGVKWQSKRNYSKEEVKNIANWAFGFYKRNDLSDDELENEFNRILAKKFKNK